MANLYISTENIKHKLYVSVQNKNYLNIINFGPLEAIHQMHKYSRPQLEAIVLFGNHFGAIFLLFKMATGRKQNGGIITR